ncbi:M55 family metallopeptidase [Elusimicrobiota bacterium]
MKVLIFVDMEGIAGVVKAQETGSHEGFWEKFRVTMTNEVNASIEGALQAGATQIDVLDWHGGGINILHDKLNPKASLIRGANTVVPLITFIKDKAYNAAFILGIHSKHGTNGVLAHTMTGICATQINGRFVGESELIAGYCGHFNIPVALVSGDSEAVKEAGKAFKNIQTVVTKERISYAGAKCFNPEVVCKELEEKADRAVKQVKACKPFKFRTPLKVRMHFATLCVVPMVTEMLSFIPTVKKVDASTVAFTCSDIVDYFKLLVVTNLVASPVYASILKPK